MTDLQNTKAAFERQLREGHYNELRVALYFMLRGCAARIGFTDGRYDVEVRPPGAVEFHVEVKWDKRAAGTGNLYFEVENTRHGCPSGISATSAGTWCHVLGDGTEALLVEVARLRAFLQANTFRSVNTVAADSNSRGLLVPRSQLSHASGFAWIKLPTVEDFFGQVFRSALRLP